MEKTSSSKILVTINLTIQCQNTEDSILHCSGSSEYTQQMIHNMVPRGKSLGNAQNKKVPEILIFPFVLKHKTANFGAK
jgi:hypothetical protein